ncbi:5-hydroxytryptamine receptor 2B-like [Lineus longissimus]|uniref:5-hydroxytryptamine receptor 2B-like n=1 Tax=Lineus longissimus TaxID=88925 RepID=UPI00315D8CF2
MSDIIGGKSTWSIHEISCLAIICVLVPFIVIGNLFVIISVIKFQRLQVPTNYLIMSLAVTDLGSGLFIPSLVIVEMKKELIQNNHLCLAAYSTILMSAALSILTLAAIAFDRYTACVNPMEYIKIVSIKRTFIMIVSIWIISIALTWGMIHGLHDPDDGLMMSTHCSFSWIPQRALAVLLGIVFFPCCLFIFFCYFRIYLIARHHARAIAAVERAVHLSLHLKYLRKDTKYAKTLGIVIGGFLVLTLPFQIVMLMEVSSEMRVNDWIINYLILLAMVNNGINPWVYAFRNGEFRAAFRRLLENTPFKFTRHREDRESLSSNGPTGCPSSVVRLSRVNSRVSPDLISMLYMNSGGTSTVRSSLPSVPNFSSRIGKGVIISPNASLHKMVTLKNMMKANGDGANSIEGNSSRRQIIASTSNDVLVDQN